MTLSKIAVLDVPLPHVPDLETVPRGTGLRQLAQRFQVLRFPELGASTRSNHLATLRHAVAHGLPDHPTIADVCRWYGQLRAAKQSERTIALHRWNAAAWYSWGNDLALVAGNPFRVAPFRVPKAKPRAILGIAKVWPSLLACAWDARSAAFLTVCRWMGLRSGEALALCAPDFAGGLVSINKQRRAWSFRTSKPKHEHCRRLTTHPEVEAAIGRIEHRPSVVAKGHGGCAGLVTLPFLFPFRTQEMGRIRRALAGAHEAFAEENEFLHVFRHSRACELLEAKNPLLYISSFLGHVNPKTTLVYLASMLGADVGPALELPAAVEAPSEKATRRRKAKPATQTQLELR
jgi:integrase